MAYPIAKLFIPPFIKLWIKKVNGLNNIPKIPFIVATNHASYFDDMAITTTIIQYLNKKLHMYCNDRFYKNKLLAKFLDWGGCIPISIQTKNKETNKKAFILALKYLKNNEPVGIFPEGGRSPDGKLRQAKTGIARLALTASVPVLPIGIIGSYDILPKGKALPRFKRCTINIGTPLHFKQFYGRHDNKKILIEVTRTIMRSIAKLANREYIY